MPIKAKVPVTEPARTFDNVLAREIVIRLAVDTSKPIDPKTIPASVQVYFLYYDANGKAGPERSVYVPDIMTEVNAGNKTMAAAHTAILAAVAELEGQE